MATKTEIVRAISDYRDWLVEFASLKFNTIVLFINPDYDFMEVFPVIPQETGFGSKYLRPDGPYSHPLYSKDEAVSFTESLVEKGYDNVLTLYYNVDEKCVSVLSEGDHAERWFSIPTFVSVPQVTKAKREVTPRHGYTHLPKTDGSSSKAFRLSPEQRQVRDEEIWLRHSYGETIKAISDSVGLSYIYTCTIVGKMSAELEPKQVV